jgi:diguanylate cyclase (GGDEF)-like protein/PAS domain S-box-containing protein
MTEASKKVAALIAPDGRASSPVDLGRVLFTAIEAMPLGVVVTNSDGKVLYINKTFTTVSGHGSEVIGCTPRFLKSGHQSKDFYRQLWTTINAGQIWDAEVINLRKDGTEYPARHIIVPIKDATGEIRHFVGFQEDLTETKQKALERIVVDETLFREREQAHVTLNSIADAVICSDLAMNVTFLNRVAERLTGWPRQEAVGRPMSEILHIVDSATQKTIDPMRSAPAQDDPSQPSNSMLIRRGDGFQIPIENSAAPIHDVDGRSAGSVIVLRDVTVARTMALQLAHSAHHDSLTGLPNRAFLEERVELAIALAARHGTKLAVLFLDLDGFKHVNDSLGHSTGDKLLISIAGRLVECVRGTDTVSRQGGDEFVVLLSEVNRAEDAAISANRILEAVAQVHSVDAHDLHVTSSLGISIYPDDGENAETLIKNADTAMYQAKDMGRQTYRFFKPAMNARVVERQSIEADLRRALERQELELHYQPKIDLTTDLTSGVEALIRWHHPTRGLISPAQFIPIAEDCRLILPIGEWVVGEACRQAGRWAAAGLSFGTMAVNVSAVQFREHNFAQRVFAIVSETGMDPRRLELELTESLLMTGSESTASTLQRLRRKGVQVALDDFGTGYSSLSYLQRFPVDCLKIDQSFIRQISTVGTQSTLVTAIINMAHTLGLRVVAEGVETREELQFIKDRGCDVGQGYYFSRPLTASAFAERLEEQNGTMATSCSPPIPIFSKARAKRSFAASPAGARRAKAKLPAAQ